MNLALFSLLFSFFARLRKGEAFILQPQAPRNITMILRVANGAHWGRWGQPEFCASGTFAIGYSLKIESKQYSGDDTALNSIKLICKALDTERVGGNITSLEGLYGSWTPPGECSHSDGTPRFFTTFALQVESEQHLLIHGFQRIHYLYGTSTSTTLLYTSMLIACRSGDDTAANFLKFKCRDIAGYTHPIEFSIPPGHGSFGTMGSWSRSCPIDSAICGMRTLVEDDQHGGDDTALNDVEFYCCNDYDF